MALRRNIDDKPAYVLLLFNAPKFTNVDIQWFVGAPLACGSWQRWTASINLVGSIC